MKITKISANELDKSLETRWRELQAGNSDLTNPYFSVEYTHCVAAARDDVYVAIIEQDNEIVGFFPYQSRNNKVAEPAGGRLSDYQGVIGLQGKQWDYESILDACGLKIWDFDHLLAAQAPARIYRKVEAVSPTMDLSGGYEEYLIQRKKSGAKRLEQFKRKARKFEREVGELQVDVYSRNEAAFQQVVEWKNAQCRSTGVPEFLNWGWTSEMLREIWQRKSPQFAGMLTILRVDDRIIAGHFGMRSESVCHWWFPTYNHQFGKYSPGGILLLKLAEAVAAEGIAAIDLGKGEDSYKPSFASGSVALLEGAVLRPSVRASLRQIRTGSDQFLHHSPITEPLRATVRGAKSMVKSLKRQKTAAA